MFCKFCLYIRDHFQFLDASDMFIQECTKILMNQEGREIPSDILKCNACSELGKNTFPRKAGVLHYHRCFFCQLIRTACFPNLIKYILYVTFRFYCFLKKKKNHQKSKNSGSIANTVRSDFCNNFM